MILKKGLLTELGNNLKKISERQYILGVGPVLGM